MKVSAEPCATLFPCVSNLAPPEMIACCTEFFAAHVEVAARAVHVDGRRPAALHVNIALGNDVLHRVVRLEQQRSLVGGQRAVGLFDPGVHQDRLPRVSSG